MTIQVAPAPMRVLWIARESGDHGTGGHIYDSRLIAALGKNHQVDLVYAQRIKRLTQFWTAALHLSVPETFGFGSAADVEIVSAAIAKDRPDIVVFSHEHLDRLAAKVRRALPGAPPFFSIRHNVTSDLMGQILAPAPPLAMVYAYWAARQERACLSSSLYAGLSVLSERDRRLVAALSGRDDVAVTPPGAPPALALAGDASSSRDLVMLGTYDWFPKRRDLERFVAIAGSGARPWTTLFADANLAGPHATTLMAQPVGEIDLSQAIRFGVITDTFAAGHKLKTSAYLLNNCHVISFAPVAEDFAFSPLAKNWIHHVHNLADIASVLDGACARPLEQRRTELRALKQSITEQLSWAEQARRLAATLSEIVGQTRA